MIQNENFFTNTSRRPFYAMYISQDPLKMVTDFAYDMCFGQGHHRNHHTGGIVHRRSGEQFSITFHEKLAEVCLRQLQLNHIINYSEQDFAIYGEGLWDDIDLIVNG